MSEADHLMTQQTTEGSVEEPTDESAVSDLPPHRYSAVIAHEIEPRWQDRWETEGAFHAANPSGPLADPVRAALPPSVVLDFFPYPSGAGLHVGHPLGYIGTDVFSRYQRMTGYNVLHTIGFDAFGLPAEQFAVQTGTHPRVTTLANMEIISRQFRRMGMAHDRR